VGGCWPADRFEIGGAPRGIGANDIAGIDQHTVELYIGLLQGVAELLHVFGRGGGEVEVTDFEHANLLLRHQGG